MSHYFLQPYKLLPFLTFNKQKWPNEFKRDYYLSFEDALWDLLPRLGYKKGSKFLVPSFYCVDVLNNMREHGYEVSEYEVNNDLSVDEKIVEDSIKIERPDIFVDFEAVGIPTQLSDRIERKLPFHTLIIKDKVHSLVGATVDNFPINDRHLILTSTRKVSPFPGSLAIYTRNARVTSHKLPWKYSFNALYLWVKYILKLKFSKAVDSKGIAINAEKLLKSHDDLIGDASYSAPLPKIFLELIDRINVSKVEACKSHQFAIYNQILSSTITSSKEVYTIPNIKKYANKLRGFPLIITRNCAKNFLNLCRNKGLLVVSQLDDSTWAKQQKLFLLPLGPHLNDKAIKNIANIALKALTSAIQYDTITA